MAYAALVSLAQTLDQVLIRHSFVVHDEKQQIQSLHEKIVFLSTFLEDFPREATKLEARITVAANQVEDILELHILNKILGSKYGKHRSNASIFFPQTSLKKLYKQYLNKFSDSHGSDSPQDSLFAGPNFTKLYEELRKPITEINFITEEVMEIKSSCTGENEMMSTHSSASFSSTPAVKVEGAVVGFEKDLREIQERLHGESAKLEVIPIVGMGGIGKTTLARCALHHPFTLHHFDVCGLITVSQNYDKASILLSLLNSIDASTKLQHFEKDSLDLEVRIHKYLTGRRFLIVVDDIWNSEPWDDLRRVFPDDFNGSRIIITTRDAHVASYVDSSIHPYEMHLMGADLSWNLLRQKVFEEEQCPPELEEIGRQIAEKCRGLPLAIVVIAGVLAKAGRMQGTWEEISINVNEAVNTSNEPVMEILSLSYTCLPHHLRPCFLPDPSAETCDHIPPLQNLHTLKRIRNFKCSNKILELIPNLKKLGIRFDDFNARWEHGLYNLVHLQKLEKLSIWGDYSFGSSYGFFNAFALPVTLKKLTLSYTAIPWVDMLIVGSLPNLQVLKLGNGACYGSVWTTVEGQFCQLKVLVINYPDPDVWITESCHFPRLERLTLSGCHNLREIPRDIGDIPTLQLIEVENFCSSTIVESAKRIEEEQRDFGNDLLQLVVTHDWTKLICTRGTDLGSVSPTRTGAWASFTRIHAPPRAATP